MTNVRTVGPGMNRSINYHRLKGPECQLMLRRKLRLDVFPHSFPCTCGKTHDAKGDHAFSCSRSHKGSAHNQIAHQIAKALGPALATATITQSDNNMETEPRLYLTSDPLSRPYDISFNPNNPNHLSHEFTTIGFDITIANATPPLPSNQNLSLSEDCITTLTANADVFLQDFERKKLSRTNNTRANPPVPGEAVIGDLLRSNRLLIPIAIDANGHLGPMFKYTLYGTIPPPIPPRKQFKVNSLARNVGCRRVVLLSKRRHSVSCRRHVADMFQSCRRHKKMSCRLECLNDTTFDDMSGNSRHVGLLFEFKHKNSMVG